VTIAGVDGCKAGWIAVIRDDTGTNARVFGSFEGLLATMPDDAVVAVDMPIGLPDFTTKGGRGPEMLVRPLLGQRQSSVFSIPSRAAVHADSADFTDLESWYAAHRRSSEVAMRTSEPPRGVSIQAFGIFAKIREIDALMIARPELRERVIESHPEVAFWRLNGGQAMRLPKKIKGRVNPDGMEERKSLLGRVGHERSFLDQAPPRGAAADDFLDACAMMLIAERHRHGETTSFPSPPGRDINGIPVAIWV
jgi:predicted RNase H-like nuclease